MRCFGGRNNTNCAFFFLFINLNSVPKNSASKKTEKFNIVMKLKTARIFACLALFPRASVAAVVVDKLAIGLGSNRASRFSVNFIFTAPVQLRDKAKKNVNGNVRYSKVYCISLSLVPVLSSLLLL